MDGQVIRCPSCGQANKVPPLDSGKKAICGKCKSELGGLVVLTDATFRQGIASGTTIVDFWAAWCGPCRMIAPLLDELARERTDIRFAKLNVDENPRTASAFGVQGIPLLIFFSEGAEVGRVVGAVPKAQIELAIRQYLGR